MGLEDQDMAHQIDPESFGEGRSTNALLPNTRCCFCIPCFGSRRPATVGLAWWERMRTTQNEDQWWHRGIRAFRKLREWSEIVAGPKWKTFIRRFNRSRSGVGGGSGGRHGKFQYDPLSYALNFDEGHGHNGTLDDDDFSGFRNFSTRFASTSVSVPFQPNASVAMEMGKDVAVCS
ncbi:hypothetical protein FNV43_RR19816 [Rhamnella rubrinervis]|uniref:Uncharacterized protein n=1 Tax=Rhamnella rubrinervis TaxID=2594499 RepID=A0A8K0DXJ3_9ROSA|nr:hypothetical protein FNV43_RR19816 [Rhamnella rubrinervis]